MPHMDKDRYKITSSLKNVNIVRQETLIMYLI